MWHLRRSSPAGSVPCALKHRPHRAKRGPPVFERLETRCLLSVSVAHSYVGLDYNSSGGFVPPDSQGAVGPSSYVETVNQTVALFSGKTTNSPETKASLDSFFYTTGGLKPVDSGSFHSDPVVVYDNLIGRYIIGDQDVDSNTLVSNFDIAVSKTSTPGSLSKTDWNFYSITTTESGFDADYPGNLGYNADAFVFTLNMFGSSGGGHVQVTSISAADLANGVAQSALHTYHNDVNDFDLRPTTMHDAKPGDPMWLVTEHGDNVSIDVIKMTGVLSSSASFNYTNLRVSAYSTLANPLNPNGTVVTDNIDSRIDKAAEWNGSLVAAHSVAISATQDVVQWYRVNVSGGTPVLADQGRVSAGSNTYLYYPSIDINSSGQIGLTYMRSGTDSSTDYMSMYVTGRNSTDAAGTMETPVLVPAGTGVRNYADFTSAGSSGGRAGDLSGISVDPVDGSFWAANEFANTEASANWGTAIADFSPGPTIAPDHFSVQSSVTTTTAGTALSATVTALKSDGTKDTGYTGTVHFTSSDAQAALPADYTFTTGSGGDNGHHTFTSGVTLKTAGSQTVIATDKANSSITGFVSAGVTPAAAAKLTFGQQPTSAPVTTAITPAVTVNVLDPYGNLESNLNGTTVVLAIASGPAGAVLSGGSTTTSGGVATFSSLSLNTAGNYTLTASSGSLTVATSSSFTVGTVSIEDFESGNLSPYKVADDSTASAVASTTAKHDGTYGLLDTPGNDWIYRTDSAAQVKQGDTISVWLQFSGTADGRAYFGFGPAPPARLRSSPLPTPANCSFKK